MVVAVLAVMGIVGLPAMRQWWDNGAAQNAAHTLMFHLKEARVTAMSESRRVYISFDPYGYVYDDPYALPAGATCSSCRNVRVPFSEYSKGLHMAKKNTTNIPPATISFSSQGTASNTTVDILSGAVRYRVVLNTVGRARMCNDQQIQAGQC